MTLWQVSNPSTTGYPASATTATSMSRLEQSFQTKTNRRRRNFQPRSFYFAASHCHSTRRLDYQGFLPSWHIRHSTK